MRKLLLFCGLLLAFGARAAEKNGTDITGKLADLGTPAEKRYSNPYARNVWTLKAFDGKIFVGCGNSSNGGPASNAGPVPVFSFDPRSKKFTEEGSVPDEQIDVYRVIDNVLYIPGHDPKGDWKFCNFYRRKAGSGKWEIKQVSLDTGWPHNYDMTKFDDKLYAAGYGLYVSADQGAHFTAVKDVFGGRFYTFLDFPEKVYAVADIRFNGGKTQVRDKSGKVIKTFDSPMTGYAGVGVCEKGKGFVSARKITPKGITPEELMPGVQFDKNPDTPYDRRIKYKICRPLPYKGNVLYIGGIQHNDHQLTPLGAFHAVDGKDNLQVTAIGLPEKAEPWHFAVAGGKALLLFSVKKTDGKGYVNHVWQSEDGLAFSPLFYFQAKTFARAIEYLDGYLYFGLGTEVAEHGYFVGNSLKLKFDPAELHPDSGKILRYKWSAK